jgi:hypothetical protein
MQGRNLIFMRRRSVVVRHYFLPGRENVFRPTAIIFQAARTRFGRATIDL